MKILFISHSFPPILGGVESQNYNLSKYLKKLAEVKVLANTKGKSWLPIFVPITFLKALFSMSQYDACLLGNGVLAPLGAVLKIFYPAKRFVSVVHALDITYCHKKGFLPFVYRHVNIPSLKRLHKLIMVGNFTIDEAVQVGIKREKCVFIPNGVVVEDFKENHTREELSKLFGEDTANKKVILRLGRFVPHKGTSWFIGHVMPNLPEEIVMIATGYRVKKRTAGDPDNFEKCQEAIEKNNLQKRVRLLPTLPQRDLKVLLNTADLVVAPNIKIPGSSEGFGINVIEAGACECIVVASELEGLKDAIKDGENGFLVESGNAEKWVQKIEAIFSAGDDFRKQFGVRAAQFVRDNYSWDKIAGRYVEELEKVINK